MLSNRAKAASTANICFEINIFLIARTHKYIHRQAQRDTHKHHRMIQKYTRHMFNSRFVLPRHLAFIKLTNETPQLDLPNRHWHKGSTNMDGQTFIIFYYMGEPTWTEGLKWQSTYTDRITTSNLSDSWGTASILCSDGDNSAPTTLNSLEHANVCIDMINSWLHMKISTFSRLIIRRLDAIGHE